MGRIWERVIVRRLVNRHHYPNRFAIFCGMWRLDRLRTQSVPATSVVNAPYNTKKILCAFTSAGASVYPPPHHLICCLRLVSTDEFHLSASSG